MAVSIQFISVHFWRSAAGDSLRGWAKHRGGDRQSSHPISLPFDPRKTILGAAQGSVFLQVDMKWRGVRLRSKGQNWSMEVRRGRLHQLQQGDLHRRCSRALDAIAVNGINEVRLRPGTLVTESSTDAQADERLWAVRRTLSTPVVWNAEGEVGEVVSNRPLIPRLILQPRIASSE
jgi:hypothetical protein